MLENDDDLRARFEALAEEDVTLTPEFPRNRIVAHRSLVRGSHARRLWFSAGSLAAAGAAAAMVLSLRQGEPEMVEPETTMWTAPSDFLLEMPSSDFLGSVPSVATPIDSTPLTEAESRPDSSEE
jgi:hypothetical protein